MSKIFGAIIGDIVGSRFEFDNHKSKDFELFDDDCMPTDDSYMTIAVAQALLKSIPDFCSVDSEAVRCMQNIGRKYQSSYGNMFLKWLNEEKPKPYNSFGNGSAMRISPVAYVAKSIDEVKELSRKITAVSHSHPEGVKGAEATAVATYMALNGFKISEIKDYIINNYYNINFSLDDIRDSYNFDESCQGTVPYALEAFFESVSFEDAIRNAISIGGDSDTIGAVCGSVAGAYYGVHEDSKLKAIEKFEFEHELVDILMEFERKFLETY